eukprot:g6890.t1
MCCDENGTWNKDDGIRCVLTVASNDQFTLLRNQVEADLAHYGLMDDESLKQMWRKLDRNGDNEASLAEVEALVTQMCDAKIWPKWINNPDSIKRAFEKAAGLDGANDEAELGIRLTQEEAESDSRSAGKSMDGGLLPFSDFCSYVRQRVQPKHNANFDKKPVAKDAQLDTLRKSHGEQATHGEMMIKKTMADFDKLEKEIKGMIKDNDQDFNGNNVVSLAEIDKMAVEQFPLLNHKPALMRAYKASFGDEGDEFIHKREFKILLANLFYFNKLFWLFDQVDQDHDRRMDIKEFTWCMSMCGLKLSQPKLEAEFKKIDQNGGGIILFDDPRTGEAHNAMRPLDPKQSDATCSGGEHSLVLGTNALLGPFSWIGLCGPKMLSAGSPERAGILIDRTSHTTPHRRRKFEGLAKGRCFTFDYGADGFGRGEGTSGLFAECIRASLKEANVTPADIRVAELHGTGTALGDPIEVGALRGVMKVRDLPILKTSAKSNLAHGEANAGMAGLVKCVLMLNRGTVAPNVHFYSLNPHLDLNGYPCQISGELLELGSTSGYAGVSSFGFGGTNARLCYEGSYLYGQPPEAEEALPSGKVYIKGTWTAFGDFEEMKLKDGVFHFQFRLGETRCERFYLAMDKKLSAVLPFVLLRGGADVRVKGPCPLESDHYFFIDGRDEEWPEGSLISVAAWCDEQNARRISWRREPEEGGPKEMPSFAHSYQVTGSLTQMKMIPMKPIKGLRILGFLLTKVFKGAGSRPGRNRPKRTSIPVRGPDAGGAESFFAASGAQGERLLLRLEVADGHVTVSASFSSSVRTWHSQEGRTRRQFFVAGTWAEPSLPMTPDPEDPDRFLAQMTVASSYGKEEFQIWMDEEFRWKSAWRIGVASHGSVDRMDGSDGSTGSKKEIRSEPRSPPDARRSLAARCVRQDPARALFPEVPNGASFEICLDLRCSNKWHKVTWRKLPDQRALL